MGPPDLRIDGKRPASAFRRRPLLTMPKLLSPALYNQRMQRRERDSGARPIPRYPSPLFDPLSGRYTKDSGGFSGRTPDSIPGHRLIGTQWTRQTRTLNPQVPGSNPGGRTQTPSSELIRISVRCIAADVIARRARRGENLAIHLEAV